MQCKSTWSIHWRETRIKKAKLNFFFSNDFVSDRPLCEEKKESQQVRGERRAGVNGIRARRENTEKTNQVPFWGTILGIVHNPVPMYGVVYVILCTSYY